jgi:hypothetical protein
MFKLLLILVSLFSAEFAFADTIFCATHEIYYTSRSREGGAPPAEGAVIGKEVLSLNGSVSATNILHHKTVGETEFTVNFDKSTLEVLKKTGDMTAGSLIFTEKLMVQKVIGQFPNGRNRIVAKVLCSSTWNRLLP